MSDVSAVKVTHLSLEFSLHHIYSWIVPHLYQSIVDLPHVDLVQYLLCLQTTLASILRLAGTELFSMRRSIKDMEDVAESGTSNYLHPTEIFASTYQSIMNCFRLITSSTCMKGISESNSIMSIREV